MVVNSILESHRHFVRSIFGFKRPRSYSCSSNCKQLAKSLPQHRNLCRFNAYLSLKLVIRHYKMCQEALFVFFAATEAELDAKKQELQEHFQAEQVRIKPLLGPSLSQVLFSSVFSLLVIVNCAPISPTFTQHILSCSFHMVMLKVPQFGARTPKQAVHKLKQS